MVKKRAKNMCDSENSRSVFGGAYGLAFIGAFIYYIQGATSFWQGVLGFFKALLWPAFLMHRLFQFLGM